MHIAGDVAPQTPSTLMGPWSLYLAIVVVSIGLYILPVGAARVDAVADGRDRRGAAGPVLGRATMAASYSGFVGAIVAVPFSMLAARIKAAPPAIVMMLAAFWSLVPGALSFEAVGEASSMVAVPVPQPRFGAGAAILSIALGTLVG